jgi:signal transduction histidine kinase
MVVGGIGSMPVSRAGAVLSFQLMSRRGQRNLYLPLRHQLASAPAENKRQLVRRDRHALERPNAASRAKLDNRDSVIPNACHSNLTLAEDASSIVQLRMQKRESSLLLAAIFSLVIYAFAFVQFSINFANFGLPDRWFLQFGILLVSSLICTALQFLLQKNEIVVSLLFLLRLVILLVATHPLGNYINIRAALLTSLVFETMMYYSIPVSFFISAAMIAVCLFSHRTGPSWDQQISDFTVDNLLFMGFSPLIVMVLGAFLQNARRLAFERKKLALQLRKASTNLVETNIALQEHIVRSEERAKLLERERISRELHDSIGYTLMNIIATMKASMELAKSDRGRMRDFMIQGIEQAHKGMAETRTALRALRSISPDPPGVITAVNRLVAAFKDTHITVRAFYSNIPWHFGEDVDSIIYRVAQEGITNAIRHGNSTEISIHVSLDGENIQVTISDNGGGAVEIKDGIGLAGIRERLSRVGGRLSVRNSAGGFQLSAGIPFTKGGEGKGEDPDLQNG